jgi:hypothetical protein
MLGVQILLPDRRILRAIASGIDRQFGILLTNRRLHTNKAELPC